MKPTRRIAALALLGLLAAATAAPGQRRPYIGFAYPAGGRQGTTVEVKLGGQDLNDVHGVLVTGPGVTAKVLRYERRLNNQDVNVLREQLAELKKSLPPPPKPPAAAKPPPPQPQAKPATKPATKPETKPAAKPAAKPPAAPPPQQPATPATPPPKPENKPPAPPPAPPAKPLTLISTGPATSPPPPPPPAPANPATLALIDRIEKRIAGFVPQPAAQSLGNLAFIEVSIAADAPPGERELRLITPQGVSNPLVFYVGQFPEYARKPMATSPFQVLGKESLAKRVRPPEEVEQQVTLPCTVNGQVASGEVNLYRFSARKGQNLVFTTTARRLVPYIADAVPGWFQPVLRLCDAAGNEVAYVDDFRFDPDPTIFYQVPADGEYVLGICDAIFRGREDFVYRISIGELPFITHIFPPGGRTGALPAVSIHGWNLDGATLVPPPPDAPPGQLLLTARKGNLVTNPVPFAVDSLPECLATEPADHNPAAQQVSLPVIVNGRIDRPDDRDTFSFPGRAGETVVAEVIARRLGSPLDSALALLDPAGALLAFSDDSEDKGAGINTHHADSLLTATLPADGVYQVRLTDSARAGGPEFGYRLRLSAPRPDFEMRVVPSSVALRGKSSARVNVFAIRKDGFNGTIRLALRNPPPGFSAAPVSLPANAESVAFTIKTDLMDTALIPVRLEIEGRFGDPGHELVHPAVPAEDRMQAFLWRHLVPAADFQVLVFDPAWKPPLKRPRPITSRF